MDVDRDLFHALLISSALIGAATLGAVFATRRLLRRLGARLRLAPRDARASDRLASARVVAGALPPGWTGSSTLALAAAASPQRRTALLLRRRLHGDVAAARAAVDDAVQIGAPVGDLPQLMRRLEGAAQAEDAVLGMLRADSSEQLAEARSRVADLGLLAAQLRSAAVAAVRTARTPETEELARDIRTEVEAVLYTLRNR
jgi:hypothetical protein